MKNRVLILLSLVFALLVVSCKNDSKKNKAKPVDKIEAQTLGLAYLEEFKLPEAEQEFLRYIELAPNEKLGYANLGLTYLRMGKYKDAENQLLKAIKIEEKDADVRLILVTVYQMEGENDKAITTLTDALKIDPNHKKILYSLIEIYGQNTDEESQKQQEFYTQQLVEKAPENLVPRLNLIGIYIHQDSLDKALAQLEIIKKQFPEFPKEANPYYKKTVELLKKNDKENAVIQFTIFQNYMKVSSPYQAGMMDLKGPGGSLIGFPLITYDQQSTAPGVTGKSILKSMKFTNITTSIGLDSVHFFGDNFVKEYKNTTHVEAADYNGDGAVDLYVGSFDPKTKTYKHYLFNNDMVNFKDVASEVGLNYAGNETSAIFTDFDNDGFLDLYVVKDNGDVLYRNSGKNHFENVTEKVGIGSKTGGNKALFVDLDHDGDLDLFEAKPSSNLVFRNNGDGTFTEQAEKMGLATNNVNCMDAAFGDFDDDGDIDLFTVNKNASNKLYTNQRQGNFTDITDKSGLKSLGGSKSVAVADFNNDGFLDLFVGAQKGESVLYKNKGDGSFEVVKTSPKMFQELSHISVNDVKFFDFDNDGFQDILIAGESDVPNGRGLLLFHNDGNGKFSNMSNLLPDEPKSGNQIALFDYNEDGDTDIVIAGVNGGVFLLRNDGGNLNHYVNMKLVGLRTGSAKNNFFGIGSKVEMRSGDLYQTTIVTNPNVHFGLGNRTKADVIRITWTNGVPQNIFQPGANQALIEAQTLKGSCPFLYTWNGKKYVFAKDIIWRSALGMPLGIMGGKTMHAFPNASDDYLKIPKEMIKPKNGKYSIQVTSELWETIYMDQIQLVAVDHPDSVDVFVPEQFTPPPFPGLAIHQVTKKLEPDSAIDQNGADVLSFITKKDDKYLADFNPGKYQGTTEMHSLILDLGAAATSKNLYLYLNGWIFPTDASINAALSQSKDYKPVAPYIQVKNEKGEWQTVVPNLGFPMGKDKTVIADLSGKFLSNDHHIKIETNMEIYWDYIFFATSNPKTPFQTTVLNPVEANFHYRGFSESYRKGGRYGPHWFNYYNVSKEAKWRDLAGNYTRYGNVQPLLLKADNEYIISNAGDETSINFDETQLPKLKKGYTRDFFIHSVGWVKDGDINTSLGNAVLPLPFHGMKSYPPLKEDVYPNTLELIKYNKEYNTRKVTSEPYKNALKNK